MRLARWLMIAAALSMPALGGCDGDAEEDAEIPPGPLVIDQSSPRKLLMTVHKAATLGDIEAFAACVDPEWRKPIALMARPLRQYIARLESIAELAADKIGREQAAFVRRQIANARMKSPLVDVVEDGKVTWRRVSVNVDDDKASADVAGTAKAAVMRRIEGKWYMVPLDADSGKPGEANEKEAERKVKELARRTEALSQIEQGIHDGAITGENFRARFDKVLTPEDAGY